MCFTFLIRCAPRPASFSYFTVSLRFISTIFVILHLGFFGYDFILPLTHLHLFRDGSPTYGFPACPTTRGSHCLRPTILVCRFPNNPSPIVTDEELQTSLLGALTKALLESLLPLLLSSMPEADALPRPRRRSPPLRGTGLAVLRSTILMVHLRS